ncbi:MAG: hypothetical protein DCC71_03835 [Proteobacteria bacterium]|nr:MAG: hypothetical protein DCC71_03835 [Pseudomonadota bacterium]
MATQIESASTPEQHQKLADEYRAKATEARDLAQKHRGMAKMYGRGKQVVSQGPHCNRIADRHDQNAADYDAMAAAHAAQAQK